MDKWFVYQWSEIIHGEKIPFYVGVGKIRKHIGKYRYRRAYETHQYSTNKKTISQKTKKGLEVSKNYRKSTPVEYRGIQYESLREMAKSTGISRHKIKNMILCGDVSKSNGLH